jgi:hypothetical protein
MTNHSSVPATNGRQNRDHSWTDQEDELGNFALGTQLADVSLQEVAGALAKKTEESASIPLVFQYSASTRQTSYRRGEAIVQLADGKAPPESCWVEIDPRMSLRKALDLYGEDLLAFEKVVRRITLEVLVLPVRQRHEQTLRVLIRRTTKAG